MSSTPIRSRSVLPLIFAITVTGILNNSLLSPAIPDILEHFDKPDSAAGLLVAVGSIPGIVVAPLIGLVADRVGRRRILVPCLMVFGVFGIVAATAPTYNILLLARLAMGFGSAGMINLAIVLIGDYFPDPTQRTKLVGRNSAALTLGLALVPVTSGFVTELASWRWALGIYSVALATALAAWVVLSESEPDTTADISAQIRGALQAVKDPRITSTLVIGVLIFALIFGVFLTVVPTHLDQAFGLEADSRGLMIGVPAIPSTIAAFNMGRVTQKLGFPLTISVCGVVWVVAFVVIASASTLWLFVLGAILYGFAEGALIPALQDVAMGQAPGEHRGAVVAALMGSARLGQTIGPFAAGAVLSFTTTYGALWFGVGLAVITATALVVSPLAKE